MVHIDINNFENLFDFIIASQQLYMYGHVGTLPQFYGTCKQNKDDSASDIYVTTQLICIDCLT